MNNKKELIELNKMYCNLKKDYDNLSEKFKSSTKELCEYATDNSRLKYRIRELEKSISRREETIDELYDDYIQAILDFDIEKGKLKIEIDELYNILTYINDFCFFLKRKGNNSHVVNRYIVKIKGLCENKLIGGF